MAKIICIAGFGDNSSMFQPLQETRLHTIHELISFNLPGFGSPRLSETTTLARLAEVVDDYAREIDSRVIVAHSVASIVASLAALRPDSSIETVLSLEGNLTADDAYFSGTAADFDNPSTFRTHFLARLDSMVPDQPIIARYRDNVEQADPSALWELGTDARRFSEQNVPGETLSQVPSAVYLYNPANVPQASLDWLKIHALPRVVLEGASHWASVDQPQQLSEKIIEVLGNQPDNKA